MSVLVSVFYPMWYRTYRQSIKDKVILGDFTGAQNILSEIVAENDQYLIDSGITNEGVELDENSSLHHALDHVAVSENNTVQQQATIDALNEE